MSATGRIFEQTVRRSGLASLVRRTVARRRVSILVYHNPDATVFARHLEYLAGRYSFVRLGDVIRAQREDRWGDLPDYPLVITFDDGWRGNRALADLCRRYGCPITIYACSQIVDTARHYWWTETVDEEQLKSLSVSSRLEALRASAFDPQRAYSERQSLSRAEATEMLDIAEFGSHTRFHPILTACSDEEAWTETAGSKEEIEAFFGRPCEHFAYPNGDHTEREVAIVARAGYASARTVDAGWNDAHTDPFRLRAVGLPDDASIDRLAADLAGAGFVWAWLETRRWDGKHPTVKAHEQLVTPGRTPPASPSPGQAYGGDSHAKAPRGVPGDAEARLRILAEATPPEVGRGAQAPAGDA